MSFLTLKLIWIKIKLLPAEKSYVLEGTQQQPRKKKEK